MTAARSLVASLPAPAFSLDAASGARISLADLAGQRVILYFYPKQNTPGCTTQACDFRDNLNSLRSAGYTVLGISPDPVVDLQGFVADFSVNYELLSDEDHSVAEAYGAWGEKIVNDLAVVGLIRSTFVIAADGTLERVEYDVQAQGHVAALRRDLGIDPA
ncbi:thioredoxin-dependent thiol peroxidase [Micrococcales bacterium 31B]|nr:thioredoxin-dependent thiol peroxidase [Micrococcales bacterium 31B]